MDKPNRGNTITIKLNNENKHVSEEPQLNKQEQIQEQPLPKVIEIDTEPEENEAFFETAAAEDAVDDESFDWIIPESSSREIEEFKIVSSKKNKKMEKKKASSSIISSIKKSNIKDFRSIIISAVCAIILGTGFGILMLKLISTDQSNKPAAEPAAAMNQETTNTNVNTTSAVIKAFTAFVVQGGVFSSKDSANSTEQQLADNGAPSSTVKVDGKQYYLFIGVSDKIDTAKKLGSYYIGQGINDVWAHSISIPEKTISNITADDKAFLESALQFYQQLSNVTATAIITTSLSDQSGKVISQLDQQVNSSKQSKNNKIKELQADLSNSVAKLQNYQKSKSTKDLIDAQQNLLDFLSLYYSL